MLDQPHDDDVLDQSHDDDVLDQSHADDVLDQSHDDDVLLEELKFISTHCWTSPFNFAGSAL